MVKLKEIGANLSKDELIKRLQALSQHLEHMAQDSSKIEIKKHVEALARPSILKHPSADVRLHAAVVLSDVIRIYAPNSPYTVDEEQGVFELFVKQLERLGKPKAVFFERAVYVLENLSDCEAFVKIIDWGPDLYEEQIEALFRTIFDSVRADHDVQTKSAMLSLMVSVIQCADSMWDQLLETIFSNLVGANKTNQVSYSLARNLLWSTESSIQGSVSLFFNSLLSGSMHTESDLADNAYELVGELATVAPMLLESVVPLLESQMMMEDVDARIQLIKTAALLFSVQNSNMVATYSSFFRALVARRADIDPKVRFEVVAAVPAIIAANPSASASTLNALMQHLTTDEDPKVRGQACTSIYTVACTRFQSIEPAVLKQLFHRTKDRKPEIRVTVITQLADLFVRYAPKFDSFDAVDREWSTVADIPQLFLDLINNFSGPNDRETMQALRTAFANCVPASLSPETRCIRLYRIFLACESRKDCRQMKALTFVLKQSKILRKVLHECVISLQELDVASSEEDHKTRRATAKLSWDNIVKSWSLGSTFGSRVMKLLEGDANHLNDLSLYFAPSSDARSAKRARISLLERFKGKGNDLEAVLDLVVIPAFDATTAAAGFEIFMERESSSGLKMLRTFAEFFPCYFVSTEVLDSIALLLDPRSKGTDVEWILPVIDAAAKDITHTTGKRLKKPLTALACKGSEKETAVAVRTLAKIYGTTSSVLTEVMKSRFKQLVPDTEQLPSALAALKEVAIVSPALFSKSALEIRQFIVDELLLQNLKPVEDPDDNAPEWETDVSNECASKVLGVELLATSLVSSFGHSGGDKVLIKVAASTIGLLIDTISNCGEIVPSGGTPPADAARIRLAAAKAIVDIYAIKDCRKFIEGTEYQKVAFMIQDSCSEVREQLAAYLGGPGGHQIPFPFVAMLVLAAADPEDKLRNKAMQALKDFLSKRGAAIQREMLLPFVVHLLAHHPDFLDYGEFPVSGPLDENQLAGIEENRQYFDFFLKAIGTGAGHADIDYMLALAELQTRYLDSQTPEFSGGMNLLAELAHNVLLRVAKQKKGRTMGKDFKVELPAAVCIKPSKDLVTRWNPRLSGAFDPIDPSSPAKFTRSTPIKEGKKKKAGAKQNAKSATEPTRRNGDRASKHPSAARYIEIDSDDGEEDHDSEQLFENSESPIDRWTPAIPVSTISRVSITESGYIADPSVGDDKPIQNPVASPIKRGKNSALKSINRGTASPQRVSPKRKAPEVSIDDCANDNVRGPVKIIRTKKGRSRVARV